MNIRNIGIFAHVDAGKTSITENMLFLGGVTNSLGSVDNGTTQTDFLEVEKNRGISVRSSLTSLVWKDVKVNLVDTPGHVDFSADVERVLRVIDAAVLVISAIDGVQSQTESIWNALKEREIPVLLFVNKIDRAGVHLEALLEDLSSELCDQHIPLQTVDAEGSAEASIQKVAIKDQEQNIEKLAGHDDVILEQYLEGVEIPEQQLHSCFREQVKLAKVFPLLFGSAKLSLGVQALLDAIVEYLPGPVVHGDHQLSALVYSVYHDPKMGKMAYARIFEGSLKVKEGLRNLSRQVEEKVQALRAGPANNYANMDSVQAGDIVGISGLTQAHTGDILGQTCPQMPEAVSLNASLLTVQVKAKEEKQYAELAEALQTLAVEDPSLDFEWYREDKEMHVKVMGWIQIEVLQQILEHRFGVAATFEDPTVIYKETPVTSGFGIGHYTMPKPCWAIVRFLIEPGPRGSGVQYQSLVRTSDVHQKYQNEVERTIPKALTQGIKGWEVTDIKITLVEGEDHQMHSRPGNFVLATPMGIMLALEATNTKLLEPILWFKITASDELLGKITSEIIQMRGSFESPIIVNNKLTLLGTLPVATSLDFPVRLSSLSGGKAKMISRFYAYADCPDELGKIRPFKGISPLDRSKYILKMRKALEA